MSLEEVTLMKIKALVAAHSFCSIENLSPETRLGEDLRIVGDDAEELLEEFARTFKVDMTGMTFSDYFPDEATSNMYYYLTTITRKDKENCLLKLLKNFESKRWRLFANKKVFKTITINDLLLASQKGRWI